jgi:drug/metabolite transporter superfamily protein YnfA
VRFIRNTVRRFGIAGDFVSFLWSNKRWWMVPMMIVLLVFGVVLILAQSSAIAPFIYTLF